MIEVNALTKSYGGHTAIREVSFTVGKGEVVGFLGPNGAGKTTTMRIICGCIGATKGTVTMDGVDITLVGVNLVDPATAGGESYTVDVWAQMDTANRLDAVAGNSSTTKLITTGGTFWQSGFAGALSTANNEAFWASFPSMEFDSFITIGCWSSGCAGLDNTLQTVGIDFSEFEAGGDMTTSNGTWFVVPGSAQGDSGLFQDQTCQDSNGVLIARLTVRDLAATVQISALFSGRNEVGDSWSSSRSITIDSTDCDP